MEDVKKTLERIMTSSRVEAIGEGSEKARHSGEGRIEDGAYRTSEVDHTGEDHTDGGVYRTGEDHHKGECPHCRGRGFIVGADDVAARCSCMDIQLLNNRIKSARLSPELRECRLDAFDFSFYEINRAGEHRKTEARRKTEGQHLTGEQHPAENYQVSARKAWQAARDFVDNVIRNPHYIGLLYTGQAGSGKTYLAAAIANELIKHNLKLLFVVVPDLLDELRASYDRKDVSELDILDMAKTVPILILDDLGAHNYTDWTRNRIYSILNHRVNERLPLIVTTNLHHGDIAYHLGERTSSRLVQMCRMFKLSAPQDIRWQQYYTREKNDK